MTQEKDVPRWANCYAGESIYDAVKRVWGPEYMPVVRGMGIRHPDEPGMVGRVSVRPGENFAVVLLTRKP